MIGKADIVESVVGVLDEKKKGWEADAEDRKLRNYTETIEVDPIFHSKIIGYKVNKMTHIGTILKDSWFCFVARKPTLQAKPWVGYRTM